MGKGKKKITMVDEIPLQDPLLCSNDTVRLATFLLKYRLTEIHRAHHDHTVS